MTSQNARLRVLMVEDSEEDARLLVSEFTQAGLDITHARVEIADEMRAALNDSDWDIVISDHTLPRFSSLDALQVLKDFGKDIPFIIYSGEVSEHVEVAAMCSGAQDSIHKGNFARLLPAVERELHSAAIRRAKEQADGEVRKLAFYDTLTGLPNRNLFCNHVTQKLSHADGRTAAIYVVGIDRFRRINNCFGHKIGDALIRQIGQRLQDSVPDDGMVARLGSDQFAVFLAKASDDDQARNGADQIMLAFEPPFIQGTLEFRLGASIGIAVSSLHGEDVPELLINAETAMFRAKSRGGSAYQIYECEMGAAAGKQLILESALRGAAQRQELILEYQPCLSTLTGELKGVEALVRWRHPQLGVLQPDEFIPLANESGLIKEIGQWVLQNACRQAKAWHDAGHCGLTMAVNLSAVQFWQPGLAPAVAKVLADTGIEPACLELEITESVLMGDAEATIATLHALKSMRVRISVDDFGTGYSSLSYLRRFPIDILKIDKSFSCDATRNPETAAIVQAIGALGRSLGLETVAEGVETADQLKFFRQQRYDRVQGFLFSAARSAADITALLNAPCVEPILSPSAAGALALGVIDHVRQIPTQEFAHGAA